MRLCLMLLVAVVAGCGCGIDPGHVPIDVRGAPSWAVDGVDGAARLLHEHGVEVVLDDDGIPVHVEAPANVFDGAWGDYHHTATVSEIIVASDANAPATPFFKSCLIAHEIGHVIGMQHVADGPSMMSATIYTNQLGTTVEDACYWSALDQAELDRVLR